MKKQRIKDILDYIPLAILAISAINLLWTVATTDIILFWKHYIGLCFLPLNYIAFWWRHKIGFLFSLLTIILGILSLLSYSPAVFTSTWYIGIAGSPIPVFRGQSIFLLWLVIQMLVSFRHFVGILSKKYWDDIVKLLLEKNDSKYVFEFEDNTTQAPARWL